MGLSESLQNIATSYNQKAGVSASSRSLIRSAGEQLKTALPGGLIVKSSGGQGTATFTPWFAVLDPDETDSPQRGLYVVYIFSSDMRYLYLTLMQGVTQIFNRFGRRRGRSRLAREGKAIYDRLPRELVKDLTRRIDLGTRGFRQAGYVSATIAAEVYDLSSLPSEAEIKHDLSRFLSLYQTAIDIKRDLLQSRPGVIVSPSIEQMVSDKDPLRDFKPRDGSEYVAYLQRRRMVKSRRHEKLIEEYGEWITNRGYKPSNQEPPKDLVLRGEGISWLVEVKVLYQGNATEAVRAAVGQLLAYRHFLYPKDSSPELLALFSEPVGRAYVRFLESLGIESVWKTEKGWEGSSEAQASQLCG